MDGVTDLPALQHSDDARTSIRDLIEVRKYLKQIDVKTWDPLRIEWLWKQCLKEDYAIDDLGAATPELFISNLFQPNVEYYEYGDDALITLLNIVNGINADIHCTIWGDVSISTIVDCHNTIAEHLFNEHGVNRLTAYIPTFNKKMVRFCTILGYKYEGEIRQIFLKNRVYHNLYIYGLLQKEYTRRKEALQCQVKL